MKRLLFGFVLILSFSFITAQEKVYLWQEGKAPGSKKVKVTQTIVERDAVAGHKNRAVTGVTNPYFEVFKPAGEKAKNGIGLLIIPGGAYARVVYDKEGTDYTKEYLDAGYTCFVLVYRTPNDGHKAQNLVPLQDAQRAMRIINANATEYGVESGKVGVVGSSAGGHVAASLATRFLEEVYEATDKIDKDASGWTSCKPAFQILVYPVITMQDGKTHQGSQTALLGQKAKSEEKDIASCEMQVKEGCPPAFIICATTDSSVNPMTNAIAYWQALKEKKCKVELHIFPESGHGFGVVGALGTAKAWQKLSCDFITNYVK